VKYVVSIIVRSTVPLLEAELLINLEDKLCLIQLITRITLSIVENILHT
jgi:hypothetical protein